MTANTDGTISRVTIERGWVIAVAVIAIVVGVVALLLPGVTLLAIAILFGIQLVASGVFRLIMAFTSGRLETRIRVLSGVLGALILIAGILCLSNPWNTLGLLGLVIGVGWIFDGVASIMSGRTVQGSAPRWLPVAAGIASIIAGVLVTIMPVLALSSFVIVAAILLIIVGVSSLLLVPRAPRDTAAAAG